MVKWPRVVLLALLVALGVWGWIWLHPSPEKIIRKKLDGLAHTATFGPNQGFLAKVASAQHLASFFATNVEVQIATPGGQQHSMAGREEIQQAALGARASLQGLSVTFPDVTVIVNADGQSAVADLTLRAGIVGNPDMIVQELKLTFRKVDNDWLIVKVETVRMLSWKPREWSCWQRAVGRYCCCKYFC
jgi:hypothetical protein